MQLSNKTILTATKWSAISQIISKLALPISSMILARILAPSVYGIVASVNMVLTFCELFADAGFNKYIVQHETDEEDLEKIIAVAFWTNLALTLGIWLVISLFAKPIAALVGCPGKELAVIVACANMPLHGFASIQSAKLRRDMDFKTLFFLRVVTLCVPFVITIPLALLTRSYWALILGTLASNITHVLAMTIRLKWKFKLYFNFQKLKEMFSFSMWSMLESFFVWLINWGDVFIVTQLLTQEYLGIYKTSMSMVGQITGIISATITPVHLSALAKLQNDHEKFKALYYKFSSISAVFLIPMGVGMFIYQDLMCEIALGSEWAAGATLMGIWGLINSIAILFNSFSTNVLIAKGRPKVSVFVQIAQIAVILPAVWISAQVNFTCLSYTRALVRIVGMVIYSIILWRMYQISTLAVLKRAMPTIIATMIMAVTGVFFTNMDMGLLPALGSVALCAMVYFGVLLMFPSVRKTIIPALLKALKR